MNQSIKKSESTSQESKTTIQFVKQKHDTFLRNLDKTQDPQAIGFFMNEHLRLPGAYWCLTALSTMNMLTKETSRRQQILPFILACQDKESGGFGGNISHDPHITSTHYAILILSLYKALDQIDKDLVAKYISHLQNEDGSFKGDEWGQSDTRFSYCALSCLTLLDKRDTIDIDNAVNYVLRCRNMDGGFGGVPGAQSHAAYSFCGVGSLAIAGKMQYIDKDELGHWLMNRQTLKGGFNGRPQKLADVCYSWWVLASCKMIGRESWINLQELQKFVLSCQDLQDGGISDRPGNEPDVFHTFFGVAALSIIQRARKVQNNYGLQLIDPIYALPVSVMQKQFKHVKLCDQ